MMELWRREEKKADSLINRAKDDERIAQVCEKKGVGLDELRDIRESLIKDSAGTYVANKVVGDPSPVVECGIHSKLK